MDRMKTMYEILQAKQEPVVEMPDGFLTTQKLADTIDQFCKLYNVTPAQLVGESRQHHLVEIRHLCWFLAYTRLRLTLTLIGRVFNRHHTTILHGISKVNNLMETEPVLRDHINSIDLWIDFQKASSVEVTDVDESSQNQAGEEPEPVIGLA
jgi:hypothetical protein